MLTTWTVLYCDGDSLVDPVLFFQCQAEDRDHAIEQCENAYPSAKIGYVFQFAAENDWGDWALREND